MSTKSVSPEWKSEVWISECASAGSPQFHYKAAWTCSRKIQVVLTGTSRSHDS